MDCNFPFSTYTLWFSPVKYNIALSRCFGIPLISDRSSGSVLDTEVTAKTKTKTFWTLQNQRQFLSKNCAFMHIRKLRFEGLLWLLEAGEGRPWSVEQGNAYSQLLAELRPAPDMRQRRICSLNGEKQMHHWQNNELLQILWVQSGEKPEAEETCWLAADKAHLLKALALSWPPFEDSECGRIALQHWQYIWVWCVSQCVTRPKIWVRLIWDLFFKTYSETFSSPVSWCFLRK